MKQRRTCARALLSGNEALARGAYEAGVCVACAYPGTPSTEILETLSRYDEVDTQWSVNEKVAFEVALSASIAGVRSLFAAKHVGLNVAMDPLMTSAYTGVGAGFVVVSCDDPGLHSSQNEQDNRLLAKVAKIPLLEPSSPAEAYRIVKQAFAISEEFDTPVLVRLTTRISHTKENVTTGARSAVKRRPFSVDIEKYVMVPRNAYARHIALEKRLQRLRAFSEGTVLNRIEPGSKRIGIVADGVSYFYAKEMYPEASFFKVGMGYPFPARKMRRFASSVKRLYVVEELEPFIEEEMMLSGIRAAGKPAALRVGELRPEHVPAIIEGKRVRNSVAAPRKPVLCPGCMHRSVFAVLKKLRLTVTGDIGCYTLGATAPLKSLHTCLCMGAGVTFLEGFLRARERAVVGVIGDSTFVHTGIAGLINLAYNAAKGVVIILDNGTTAMTGNQPHPATGITIKGIASRRLCLEELCRAAGCDHVDVCDAGTVSAFEQLLTKRMKEEALSVIIVRSPCRLILRRKSPPPSFAKDKCTRCYRCLSIDCPAVVKLGDGYVAIDGKLCVGCNLCVEMCSFGALTLSRYKTPP